MTGNHDLRIGKASRHCLRCRGPMLDVSIGRISQVIGVAGANQAPAEGDPGTIDVHHDVVVGMSRAR